MAAGRLIWPLIEPVLNATGQVVSGAVLTVYANRTTNLATIYADRAMLTAIANPQSGVNASNTAGRFFVQTKAIWLPTGALYTLRVDRPDGTFDVIDDVQPQGDEVASGTSAAESANTGLELSNSATGLTTHIAMSVGEVADSTRAVNMVLSTPLTKRIDQAWSAGANGGARLSGSLGASQTWHWFIISKADGTTDVGADQSPTSPTLPAGYVYFRRRGAVLTDATNLIRAFIQVGDIFKLKVRSADFAAQANGAGVPYLRLITVPAGVKVEAEMYFLSTGTANTTAYLSGIYDPDFGVPPAFGGATQWAQVRRGGFKDTSSADVSFDTKIVRQTTDVNRQIYTFSSDTSDVIALGVIGWRDLTL
jgi:hypothetical protein